MQASDTLPSVCPNFKFAADGDQRFDIGRTAPLDTAVALIADQEQGKRARGKVVIQMDSGI
ncbi:MAG: hypothetical protein ABW110_17915 [Steroidobacteraceae bacterium]